MWDTLMWDTLTWDTLLPQLELLLRIVIAGICGALIGIERTSRMKVAGIRTHLLVALAAALMMVVSKYGFYDVISLDSVNLDPSRIASGIVTGISFLGAGLIFVKKREISGITTAAGVLATVGVGMAIGAGMYFIGVSAALLIIFSQFILHRNIKWLHEPVGEQICLVLTQNKSALSTFMETMDKNNVEIIDLKVKKEADQVITLKFFARFPRGIKTTQIIELFESIPTVQQFEL